MRIRFKLLNFFALAALAACSASDEATRWGAIETASPGPARSIGTYTNGCLAGAQALPPDGPGYQVMRLNRRRFYGNPELLRYLQQLANQVAADHGVLLIGDMAQPRGGPVLGGHASHQIGLEADLWYSHPVEAETQSLSSQAREEISAVSLVLKDGSAVDPTQWGAYDVALLREAASPPEVDRIFVNPAIKRALCSSNKGEPWLHKLRPWWGHDDHFHVRLKCPVDDHFCVPQPDMIPAGDGCDASLDWWFTDEAKIPAPTKPHAAATMPDACRALLP